MTDDAILRDPKTGDGGTIDDSELLRRYAEQRSEAAFAELVRRHLDLVYSAALRRLNGDAHAAADVAQQVFTALAQQSASLPRDAVLPGWLYTTTRNMAVDFIRAEQRRRAREREASTMHELTSNPPSDTAWDQLRPLLDEAMDELSEADREIVVLRFFARRRFADIGVALRLSEDAARMRVERALEKLRAHLARRGVTSTAAALTAALSTQAMVAAPAGLATTIAGAALGSTSAVAAPALSIFQLMSSTKITLGITALVAVIAGGLMFFQQRANDQLRQEISVLREANSGTKLLPAPAVAANTDAVGAAHGTRAEEVNAHAATDKARGEVSPPAEARGMVSVDNWQNRGTTTPAAALETYLWAADSVDVDVMANAIAFGKWRRQVDEFYANLSPDIRARFDSPEKLWAFVLQGAPHAESERVTGFELLAQTELPDDYVSLRVRVEKGDRTETGNMLFQRTANNWRRTLGDPDRGDSLIAPVMAMFPSASKPDANK